MLQDGYDIFTTWEEPFKSTHGLWPLQDSPASTCEWDDFPRSSRFAIESSTARAPSLFRDTCRQRMSPSFKGTRWDGAEMKICVPRPSRELSRLTQHLQTCLAYAPTIPRYGFTATRTDAQAPLGSGKGHLSARYAWLLIKGQEADVVADREDCRVDSILPNRIAKFQVPKQVNPIAMAFYIVLCIIDDWGRDPIQ